MELTSLKLYPQAYLRRTHANVHSAAKAGFKHQSKSRLEDDAYEWCRGNNVLLRSPMDRTFYQYIACAKQRHVAGDFEDRSLWRFLRRQYQLLDSLLNFLPCEFRVARQRIAEVLTLLS